MSLIQIRMPYYSGIWIQIARIILYNSNYAIWSVLSMMHVLYANYLLAMSFKLPFFFHMKESNQPESIREFPLTYIYIKRFKREFACVFVQIMIFTVHFKTFNEHTVQATKFEIGVNENQNFIEKLMKFDRISDFSKFTLIVISMSGF